jgi:hypothetical protein
MILRLASVLMGLAAACSVPALASEGIPGQPCTGSETVHPNPVVELKAQDIHRLKIGCHRAHRVARALLTKRANEGGKAPCTAALQHPGQTCSVRSGGQRWVCSASNIDAALIGCFRGARGTFFLMHDRNTGRAFVSSSAASAVVIGDMFKAGKVKPRKLFLYASDALVGLHWKGWGTTKATATGKISSHSMGVYSYHPTQAVARRVRMCGGHRTYTRLTFTDIDGSRHRARFDADACRLTA